MISTQKAFVIRREQQDDENHIGLAAISRTEVEKLNATWKTLPNQIETLQTTTLIPKASVDLGNYLRSEQPMVAPKYSSCNLLTKDGKPKVILATAGPEGLSFRSYSGPANAISLTIAKKSRNNFTGLGVVADSLQYSAIKASMESIVYTGGGAHTTLGRFAAIYPKRDDKRTLRVPSPTEVSRALVACGLGELNETRPHELAGNGELQITVMKHSSNGYPTLGRFTDEAAANWHIDQARAFDQEIAGVIARAAGDARIAVYEYIRRREDQVPHMFLYQGKGKDDYLKAEKALARKVRYYNVGPRYLTFVMQQATQTLNLSENHQTILTHPATVRTAMGITLNKGGADRLVDALEPTSEDPIKYTHCGDDSWVVLRVGESIVMMSLDCTMYDLSQRGDIMAPVDRKIHEQLSRIKETAAHVWYALIRERRVVLSGTSVYQMKDGGPSGMPLQSTRNDMMMEIMLSRFRSEALELLEFVEEGQVGDFAEALQALAAQVADELGFTCRVDDTVIAPPDGDKPLTLKQALKTHPFRFIGCIFHTVERSESTGTGSRPIPDAATVMVDVPRMCAQLRFPRNVFQPNSDGFDVAEGIRIASIVSSLGIPTPAFEASFAAARSQTKEYLERLLAAYAEKPDVLARKEADAGLTEEAVFFEGMFADVEPGLRGMLKCLRSPPENNFLPDTKARPIQEVINEIDQRLAARPEKAGWADQMDDEQEVARERRIRILEAEVAHGLRMPPAFTGTMVPFRNRVIRPPQVAIRFSAADPRQAPTVRNLGRPPPTNYHARDGTQPRTARTAASMGVQPEYDEDFDFLPNRSRKEGKRRKGKKRR